MLEILMEIFRDPLNVRWKFWNLPWFLGFLNFWVIRRCYGLTNIKEALQTKNNITLVLFEEFFMETIWRVQQTFRGSIFRYGLKHKSKNFH